MNTQSHNIDLDYLQTWLGRQQVVHDDMSPLKARALAAALARPDFELSLPENGDSLLPCWQWLYFVDSPSAMETGQDGHPMTGGFLPPVPLPRRMWAAGNYTIHAPIELGHPAAKTSTVTEIKVKQGATGTLLFVTVQHATRQCDQLCIEEEQSLVYREMPNGPSPLPKGVAAPEGAEWEIEIVPDPVLLFRFSALTFNSHRIHYDREYAVETEFYPALVVHAPLQASLLANSIVQQCYGSGKRVIDFSFRAQRPLFDTHPFKVCGRMDGDQASLWTEDYEGFVGMTATARLTAAAVTSEH